MGAMGSIPDDLEENGTGHDGSVGPYSTPTITMADMAPGKSPGMRWENPGSPSCKSEGESEPDEYEPEHGNNQGDPAFGQVFKQLQGHAPDNQADKDLALKIEDIGNFPGLAAQKRMATVATSARMSAPAGIFSFTPTYLPAKAASKVQSKFPSTKFYSILLLSLLKSPLGIFVIRLRYTLFVTRYLLLVIHQARSVVNCPWLVIVFS
jgi:hypothetical protein